MLNRIISFFISLWLMFSSLLTGIVPGAEKLRIVVPENWELCIGDSRTLDRAPWGQGAASTLCGTAHGHAG